MPITLITGLPGHGKTLYTLARFKDEAAKEGRPVFHNGINGLNIPGWQQWDVKDWQNLPAGAVMVIDEAWKDFPVRGRGEPPAFVGELARHRHLGLDFVLVTQDPMLIDNFVRRLVDRHFHIVRKFGTHSCTIHEYVNGVKETVAKSREGSIRHEWRYPKDVFDLYTSAEVHTVKRRIPMRIWLLLALPVVLLALIAFAYYRLKPENVQARMDEHAGISPVERKEASSRPGAGPAVVTANASQSPLEYAQSFTPRVEGLPHTAPVYDEVTRPAHAPYPAACVLMRDVCRCYTQQGTRLDTGKELCKQIAEGGFFVAWNQEPARAVPVDRPASAAPSLDQPSVIAIHGAGLGRGTQIAAAPVEVEQAPYRPRVRTDSSRP